MSDQVTRSAARTLNLADQWVWTVRVLFSVDRVVTEPARALPSGDCIVGRSVSGRRDLGLPDDGRLSRQHAAFKRRGEALSVHDLDSHNGTTVNGLEARRAALSDGDVVRCGDTLFLVRQTPVELDDPAMDELIGQSVAMRQLRAKVARVARTDATVVLLGETGCGKGAAARAIHRSSARRDGPWVQFNSAAIPEHLAESTLFGHVAGAFTGATSPSEGLLRAAHGGTLFIDEVGDLPAVLQPKLLHFLDDGTVLPVGSTKEVRSDARVLAATNVDLPKAVKNRSFRADLYARLAAVELRIPPLRERREDVLDLLAAHLDDPSKLSADLAEVLVLHDWPYNVREVQRLATHLDVEGMGRAIWGPDLVADRLDLDEPADDSGADGPRVTPSQEVLEELLIRHKGVVTRVARELGRSTKQVYRWMSRHGFDPGEYRD